MGHCPRQETSRLSPSRSPLPPTGRSASCQPGTISAPVAATIPSSIHQVYVALVLPVGLTADASITDTSARAMVIKSIQLLVQPERQSGLLRHLATAPNQLEPRRCRGSQSLAPVVGVRVLRDDPNATPSAGSYELDATPTSLSNDDDNRSIRLAHLHRCVQETEHQGTRCGCHRCHPDHRKLDFSHSSVQGDPVHTDDGVSGHCDHRGNHGDRPARWEDSQQDRDPAEGAEGYVGMEVDQVPANDLDWCGVPPVRQRRLQLLPLFDLACDRRTEQGQRFGGGHLDRSGFREAPRHVDDPRGYLSVYGSVSSVPVEYIQYRYRGGM